MAMTHWTKNDLATMTAQATTLALTIMESYTGYCGHCQVVAVGFNEKYCNACVEEMVDDMAREFCQRVAVDNALY